VGAAEGASANTPTGHRELPAAVASVSQEQQQQAGSRSASPPASGTSVVGSSSSSSPPVPAAAGSGLGRRDSSNSIVLMPDEPLPRSNSGAASSSRRASSRPASASGSVPAVGAVDKAGTAAWSQPEAAAVAAEVQLPGSGVEVQQQGAKESASPAPTTLLPGAACQPGLDPPSHLPSPSAPE